MYRYDRNNTPDGFYIYAYIRSKDSITAKAGTPYYIGKGIGNRAYIQHKRRNNSDALPFDNHRIVILESNLTEIGAFALERRMIRWYGRKNDGTGILQNILDGGNGGCPKGRPSPTKGKKHTEEAKAKISAAGMGRKCPKSPEHRKKLSDANKGKKLSEEEKIRRAEMRKGKVISDETRKKLSEAGKGHIVSQETRDKISASNTGKKKNITKPKSLEHRKKLSESNIGKIRTQETLDKMAERSRNISDETRKKMSKTRKGRKLTDEQKAKLSIAHRNISDETRKKISDAGKGRVVSQETRDKSSATQKGRKKSEEQKQKQRIAMLGRKNGPPSEETKKKISEANSNASEETREKLRKSRLGKVLSEETKKKIGDANRARNLIKKEKLFQPSVELIGITDT
jgi:hypothetical protein